MEMNMIVNRPVVLDGRYTSSRRCPYLVCLSLGESRDLLHISSNVPNINFILTECVGCGGEFYSWQNGSSAARSLHKR